MCLRAFVLAGVVSLVALHAASSAAIQSPATGANPAQTAGTGAISGVVTDAATHQPLQGVHVLCGRDGTPATFQSTDERGRFVFINLPAGHYVVRTFLPGFADDYFGRPSISPRDIDLADGQWFKDANIEMTRLGAINGRITDERGEPAVGAYVRVLMPFVLAGTPQLAVGPAATTDDRGEYRIAGLAPGQYIVAVPSVQHSVPAAASVADVEGLTPEQMASPSAPYANQPEPPRRNGGALVDGLTALILGNYLTSPPPVDGHAQAYPIVFYPGALTIAGAAPVELGVGAEKSGVDFSLQPVSVARISGRLDGPPDDHTGLTLRLMPTGLEDLGNGSEAATTLVNPDGSFTFLNVPAGSYTITPGSTFEYALNLVTISGAPRYSTPTLGELPVTPGLGQAAHAHGEGYVPAAGLASAITEVGYNSFVPKALDENHTMYARVSVAVGEADVTGLIVPAQRTGTLHLLVAFEDVKGPPPVGMLQLSPANGSPMLAGRSVTKSSEDWIAATRHAIDVGGLLPGEFVLAFIGMQGPSVTVKSVTVDGEDCSRGPIAVTSGLDAKVVVTFTGKIISLSGVTRDESGNVAPQASVVVFPTDPQLWTKQGLTPSWIRAATTSARGAYQLTDIKAGEYYVVGVDSSQIRPWRDPAFLEAMAPLAKRVTLNWGDSKIVDVKIVGKK